MYDQCICTNSTNHIKMSCPGENVRLTSPHARVSSLDRRGPAIGENHRSMTKRGLNLGKYRVGSIRRSLGRSVGSIAKIRGRRSSSRAHRWFRRSVRWSVPFVRSCRSFARQCSDGRETTNRATARGAETGPSPGRRRDARVGPSARRTVGPGVVVRDAKAKVRFARPLAFGLNLFIHLDWIYPFGCERVRSFVRYLRSSSSGRPNTRRAIDRLRRAFVVFGRRLREGSIGDHRG